MIKLRIRLVKLNENHMDKVRNWRNSPEVSRYMYTDQYISEEEHVNWYIRIKDDPTKKYWIVEVDDVYVGVVNLYDINIQNKRCYWAYYLTDSSVRGKGIGKAIELNVLNYAFEVLNLNKLCCEVFSFNDVVVKIHQKYGSKIEGIFKKHVYKNGQFLDIVCMGILKEEWIELKKQLEFQKIEIE